ncbi:hypothetical protein MKI79_02425 [Acinetobacter sp. A3.8]|uniref:Uncharacterized protein n=1 Tax=Acinetobacter sedimenti TaxID=2919922 RepID=A0A9X1WYE5_9GAMM|nr:hypothetical protein [Acinetobacter sedimenti]MCJ8145775.1 hypothetical protein [Acinetobacter sedimenti]
MNIATQHHFHFRKHFTTLVIPLLLVALLSSMPTYANDLEVKKPTVDIGGAVRVNYGIKDYDQTSKNRNGEFDLELLALDVDATYEDWYLDAQYRFYRGQDFDTIHHALIGFNVNPENQVEVGVVAVPFGVAPYIGNSFWFSGAYYLGFEDDYDTGIKWKHQGDDYSFDLAYFHESEYSSSDFNRYSFDVADETVGAKGGYYTVGDGTNLAANEEAGQINARFIKNYDNFNVGVSGEIGRIYNSNNAETADRYAAALHTEAKFGLWKVKAQGIQYEYDETADIGTQDGTIAISGFNFASDIASKGRVGILNISREIPINNRFIDSATCYNDFTHIKGTSDNDLGNDESMQNVTGCMLAKGGIYTYLDVIAGKNMYFAGGSGIGTQGADDWDTRFNLNIGWYF